MRLPATWKPKPSAQRISRRTIIDQSIVQWLYRRTPVARMPRQRTTGSSIPHRSTYRPQSGTVGAMGAADLPSTSERISFFDAQAAHRASARLWSAASAVLILGLGSVYGFLMLLVVSFYGLLLLGL